jgi:DNA polymerase III subunit delta'
MVSDSPDLWSEVVGQQEAVRRLQAAVRAPVHAYLLTGPEGSGRRAAALAFAAELLSEGLDAEAARRAHGRVAVEAHPALFVVEREGDSLSVEQIREVVRRAQLSPPEGSRQVIVLVDIHLAGDGAPVLLKIVEEPPEATFFVILGEELPPELETIASRCVQIQFSAVPTAAILERLRQDGVSAEVATVAAEAAGGSLARARLLARDPAVAERRDAWYRAAERLDGSGHAACVVVDDLLALVDGLIGPLEALQAEEMERFIDGFESAELEVPKGRLRAMEARHKREQRRVRVTELKSGLAVLTGRYRDELVAGGNPGDFVAVAESVQGLCDSLVFNVREALALQALFMALPPLARTG